jgi:hypothetical protein
MAAKAPDEKASENNYPGGIFKSVDCEKPDSCLSSQPEMRSSFNQLLVALAVLDSLYVATGIVDYSVVKVTHKVFLLHVFIDPLPGVPGAPKHLLLHVPLPVVPGAKHPDVLDDLPDDGSCHRALPRRLQVGHSTSTSPATLPRPLLYRSLELTHSSRVATSN